MAQQTMALPMMVLVTMVPVMPMQVTPVMAQQTMALPMMVLATAARAARTSR